MTRFIASAENLKVIMTLLRDRCMHLGVHCLELPTNYMIGFVPARLGLA